MFASGTCRVRLPAMRGSTCPLSHDRLKLRRTRNVLTCWYSSIRLDCDMDLLKAPVYVYVTIQ
jgi:hypothetical protein